MTAEFIGAITAIAGGVGALVGALWRMRQVRQQAELAWAARADAMWDRLEKLQAEVDSLRARVDSLRAVVTALQSESKALRAAIRSAGDLDALKAQERQIPETVVEVEQ
jgi:septal ring factor EnvC (AmiA/AmiB activator)